MSGEHACWLVVRPHEVLGPGAKEDVAGEAEHVPLDWR